MTFQKWLWLSLHWPKLRLMQITFQSHVLTLALHLVSVCRFQVCWIFRPQASWHSSSRWSASCQRESCTHLPHRRNCAQFQWNWICYKPLKCQLIQNVNSKVGSCLIVFLYKNLWVFLEILCLNFLKWNNLQ